MKDFWSHFEYGFMTAIITFLWGLLLVVLVFGPVILMVFLESKYWLLLYAATLPSINGVFCYLESKIE